MLSLEPLLNNETIFVYFLSFIILITLLFDLIERIRIFNNKKISIFVAFVISFYVFLTSGYLIINKILSLSTFGMIILFGLLIILIIILRFWNRAKINIKYS